jgi:sodium transport system permease protein
MNPKTTWIVLKKEIVDALRDRPAITAIALQALVSPVVWGVIMMVAGHRASDTTLTVPLAGRENAPALVEWLERQIDVEVVPAATDPEHAVRDGSAAVALEVPADYAARMANGLPAPVALVSSSGAGSSRRAATRLRALLGAYGAEVGAQRLMARGVAPMLAAPLRIDDVDVATPEPNQGGFAAFLCMTLLWLSLGGGSIALDSTAGERERGSLEPLLSNPVPRMSIVAGKWLAASCLACLSIAAGLASMLVVLSVVPWHEYGMQMRVSDANLLNVALVLLPLALLMSAAVVFVSAYARSLQQAQTYLGLLVMTTVLSGVASLVFELPHEAWTAAAPIVGPLTLVVDVVNGTTPALARYVLSTASAIGLALLLVAATARLLRRESVVFRGG